MLPLQRHVDQDDPVRLQPTSGKPGVLLMTLMSI